MFKPVEKINVTDMVYSQLLAQIFKGEWKEGEQLPSENDLTKTFNVGRNTIRQAINRLVALDLLETKQGKGTFVKRVGPSFIVNCMSLMVFTNLDDLKQIEEFRKGIEVQSAILAATNANEDDLKLLTDSMKKLERLVADQRGYFFGDLEFHLLIAEISKNDILLRTMLLIRLVLEGKETYDNTGSMEGHYEIYNAILARDPERAGIVMTKHMQMVIDKLNDIIKIVEKPINADQQTRLTTRNF